LDGEFPASKIFLFLKVFFSGDVLEVGVLEEGGVFEAVAKEAVGGDVGCPDEGQGEGQAPVKDVAGEEEREREGYGVNEVVGCGADADVDEVTEHEEVRCEEEEDEEKPAVMEMLVGEEGECEDGGFFDSEEGGGLEHDSLYGIACEIVRVS
jgi:hypothetical protein